MIYFASDYQEGCLPEILERFAETNMVQTPGYGDDPYTENARRLICKACGAPDARVFLFAGGTQTNSIVIHGILKSYEGVLSADTGHVTGHEAGAVEAKGHKVLTLPQTDGKITAEAIDRWMDAFNSDDSKDHIVQPGMVYISQPTEFGTLYSLAELEAITASCRRYGLPLFVDGARLAYALGSDANDVVLEDLARLTDAFYIGGTKCGALTGEAVVITNPDICPRFFTTMKQQGAVFAKGRIVGVAFEVLMDEGRYEAIGRHGVKQAQRIQDAFREKGFKLYVESPTNQIFVILPEDVKKKLARDFCASNIMRLESGEWVVRYCGSWATKPENVDRLIEAVKAL